MFITCLIKIIQKFRSLSIMKQILILQRLKLNAENNYRDQNMSFFMRTKDTIMYIYKTKKCFFFL